MKLIANTYFLQIKRGVKHLFKTHMGLIIGMSVSVVCLFSASAIIIKEMMNPVVLLINDFTNVHELQNLLPSFAFTASGAVVIIYMVKMIIAADQMNLYTKMLRNYGVSQIKRQILNYGIQTLYLISLSLLVMLILLGPSFMALAHFQGIIFGLVFFQIIFTTIFIQVVVTLIHIITRFVMSRWVGILLSGVFLFYGFRNLQRMHPLNCVAFINHTFSLGYFIVMALVLMFLLFFVLSFNLEIKHQKGTLLHFPFIPNHIYFKQLKETLRMNDFWFNGLLISGVFIFIKQRFPAVLNDPKTLSLILILPTMQAIYTFAQIKDSIMIYRMVNIKPVSVFMSGIVSVLCIYMVQSILIIFYIDTIDRNLVSQIPLILLSCSVFKITGLVFPLHYRKSIHEQMVVAALSLLIIPVVLIVMEIQKKLTLPQMTYQIMSLLLVFMLNIIEYKIIQRKLSL